MTKTEIVRDMLKRVEREIAEVVGTDTVIVIRNERKNHTCAWFKGRRGTKFEMEIYVVD